MGQLEDMYLFVRIVESGGIGKASEQLDIAKSAVSRRLRELESRLNVQLINRNTRTWSLSEAGAIYYNKCKSLLDDVSNINAEVTSLEGELKGTLRLSIPMSFGLQGLSSVINDFIHENPKIRLKVDLSDQLVDLVEEGIDLAIRIADLEDSTLHARHLALIRHVLVATPKYIEENGAPKDVNELSQHAFLKYSLTRAQTIQLTKYNSEQFTLDVDPIISANNADFLKKMLLDHNGIAYLPTFLVHEEIASGQLVTILKEFELPNLNAYAIYPNNQFLPKRTRAFIDFIVKHCGDNPHWDRKIKASGRGENI